MNGVGMQQAGRVAVGVTLHAEMKPVVVIGTPTVVRVRLAPGQIAASDGVVDGRAGQGADDDREVDVTVVPRGFRFAFGARHVRRMRLPSGTGEAEARFRIIGIEPGHGEVSVIVRRSGELPLATLRLTAQIVGADGSGQTGLVRHAASVTRPDPRVASLPTIRIDEELAGGRSTMRMAVAAGGETHRFTTKLADKPAFVRTTSAAVATLRDELGPTPTAERLAVARRRMQQLGASLFEDLFDPRARELLWRHRDELDGLVVQTTGEVDIPWELVHLSEPGATAAAAAAGEPRFLADTGLTRWVYDTPHPTSLPIRAGRGRSLSPVDVVGPGGFSEAFPHDGAGAFLSCSWSAGDEPAGPFVETFSDALLGGRTVAAAAREARAAARAAGGLSDLACAVYAHPDASIRVG